MISHSIVQDTPALPLLRLVCLYTGHSLFCPTASHRMCAGERKDKADVMHINIFGERKRSLKTQKGKQRVCLINNEI